jgi:chromosome segregation ATPase
MEKKSLEDQLAGIRRKCADLQTQLISVQQESQVLRLIQQTSDSNNTDLRNKLSVSNKQVTDLQRNLDDCKREVSLLTKHSDSYHSELVYVCFLHAIV